MTWKFVKGPHDWLAVDPEDAFDENKMLAVRDWLQGDLGQSPGNVERFKADWARVTNGESEGTMGNVTEQTLLGTEVRLESLYERWSDVAIPLAEFEEILDKYAEYLSKNGSE